MPPKNRNRSGRPRGTSAGRGRGRGRGHGRGGGRGRGRVTGNLRGSFIDSGTAPSNLNSEGITRVQQETTAALTADYPPTRKRSHSARDTGADASSAECSEQPASPPSKRPRRLSARAAASANQALSTSRGAQPQHLEHAATESDGVTPEASSGRNSTSQKKRPRVKEIVVEEDDSPDVGLNYFEANRGTVRTSNHTLASLDILPQEQLSKALEMREDPIGRQQDKLCQDFGEKLSSLELFLDAGHSVLVYGFGSKKTILDDLASHLAAASTVLIVNGFNPTLSLRSVLSQLASTLKLSDFVKRSLFDYVEAICEKLSKSKDLISIVLHNIDGSALRQPESQQALSRLVSVENVRLVASVDHINAPLLWDAPTYDTFDWMWIRCDTFLPYKHETHFSSKPLLRGNSERRVDGAVALLQSLSERARAVFRVLVERQKGGEHGGLQTKPTFNELYETVMQLFLVSDQTTLKTILTELSTHDLLQSRRGADSAERLWVPLDEKQLEQVMKKIETSL